MIDSRYQKNIYKELRDGKSNVVVDSVAGSGKTTTIVKCVKNTPKEDDKIFLAFNKSIVKELEQKIIYPNCVVTTMHSLCWKYVLKRNRGVKLKKNKSFEYSKEVCKENNVKKEKIGYYSYIISKAVDLARLNLLNKPNEIEEISLKHGTLLKNGISEMCVEVLNRMNKDFDNFDFIDMIYRNVLDKVRMPKFDFIFVDESQDLSLIQQLVIKKIIKPNGRMIAVGDPNQAIYGFAGADINSYNNLKSMFHNTIELPLSVSYRCSKRIVLEAKKINPKIKFFKENENGKVRNGFCKEIRVNDWVLCRNVKPLIYLNLYLISRGIKSHIRGADIGKSIKKYVSSFKCSTVTSLLQKIENEEKSEISKMRSKGVKNPEKTEKVDLINQNYKIIKVLSLNIITVKNLLSKIDKIFTSQPNSVVLSTIHKSKGLENDKIFFLAPELIPSQFAKEEWQLKQEDNLKYVAITRAKKELIYIENFSDIEKEIEKMLKK